MKVNLPPCGNPAHYHADEPVVALARKRVYLAGGRDSGWREEFAKRFGAAENPHLLHTRHPRPGGRHDVGSGHRHLHGRGNDVRPPGQEGVHVIARRLIAGGLIGAAVAIAMLGRPLVESMAVTVLLIVGVRLGERS